MKNPLLSVCLLALFAMPLFAQEPFPQPGDNQKQEQKEKPAPIIADYKDAIEYYFEWSKNIDNPDFYKTLSFEIQDKKSQSKKPNTIAFKDLPDLQKDVFYLKQAEECSNQLIHLEQAWSRVHSSLIAMSEDNKKSMAEKYKDKPALKRPPTENNVREFLDQILKIRKSHALKYEEIIVTIFTKHKDIIPATDRRHYSQRVHAWHDRQALIDRKKK